MSGSAHDRCRPPLADGWYSALEGVRPSRSAIMHTPGVRRLPVRLLRLLMRWPPTRGALLFAASVVHPVVAITRGDPGWGMLLLLRALFGRRRKLVVLQFIVHRRRHPLRRFLAIYDRWAIRRTLIRGHALTRADQRALADRYDLPSDWFAYVPWPLAFELPAALPEPSRQPLVISAGRAYCDWPTLFAAARGRDWPLVVVCDSRDRRRVERLNADRRATLRIEMPREEFLDLVRRATVSVVAMEDVNTSQGHIRVMDAVAAGVPLVVTATSSLAGYVEEGETALLVPPGDPAALRAAVERLLSEPGERQRLRTRAYERAGRWQVSDYFASLADLVHDREVLLPPAAPDGPYRSR